MVEKLQLFLDKQIAAFEQNFITICESFDFDAIHDMRVAVKRLRALLMLSEQLHPGFVSIEAEGELRELFRISGKMRDAQVQQNLVAGYAERMEINFPELINYLINSEKKSIRKFNDYIHTNDTSVFTDAIKGKVKAIIDQTSDAEIRLSIENLIQQLMNTSRSLKYEQHHDEHLHEIRRKFKQCNYLLSVFDKGDAAFTGMSKMLKELEKANDLLGEWHDHVVARIYIFKFLAKKNENNFPGFSRYKLLLSKINERKEILHNEIVRLMELEMGL